MTIRLRSEVREKLDALARDTDRSAAQTAANAIEAYVDLSLWQSAHITHRQRRGSAMRSEPPSIGSPNMRTSGTAGGPLTPAS